MATKFIPTSESDLLKALLFSRSRLAENGCWLWVGSIGTGGYGLMSRESKTVRAHRVSYEAYKGAIPETLVVRHTCDTPNCINPDHLLLGTQRDNALDREARGRRDVKGEQVGTSKLMEQDILDILASEDTGVELARRFSVSPSTISLIRLGKSWSHVRQAETQ